MQHEWQLPVKRKGESLAKATHKYELAFLDALRERSQEESARTGKLVSQATILRTLALAGDQRLAELYHQKDYRNTTGSQMTHANTNS